MSESSRSRITITLGRTGRVFKGAATELDSSYADLHPIVGSKRLENNLDSSAQINNKRLRGDGRSASDDSVKDSHLVKDDLRYKLLEKNKLKQAKDGLKNGLDLRNILSRPAQSSSNSMSTWQRMPGSKDTRLHCIEPVEGRKYLAETRDGRHVLPVTRNFSQHIPEFRAERAPDPRKQRILKAREGGQGFLEAKDIRHQLPEPGNHGVMADVSETRASNAMPRTESGIHSYSPWTLDHLRRRLPDESRTTSRGLSTPKMDEVLQRRYAIRTSDDARAGTYMNRDAFDISRPMSSSHLAKMAPPGGQMKTMGPVASPLPLSGNFTKKSSFAMEDQLSIDGFLHSLGLEKYAILFKAEEVDMYSLKRMSESDLKELGIPMPAVQMCQLFCCQVLSESRVNAVIGLKTPKTPCHCPLDEMSLMWLIVCLIHAFLSHFQFLLIEGSQIAGTKEENFTFVATSPQTRGLIIIVDADETWSLVAIILLLFGEWSELISSYSIQLQHAHFG